MFNLQQEITDKLQQIDSGEAVGMLRELLEEFEERLNRELEEGSKDEIRQNIRKFGVA